MTAPNPKAVAAGGTSRFHCSFCGKPDEKTLVLIAGPGPVFICNECVDICNQIVLEKTIERATRAAIRSLEQKR